MQVVTAHKVWHRIEKKPVENVQWTGGTNETLGEVKIIVETDNPRGMAPTFHTYLRMHTSKLVYKPGTASWTVLQQNFRVTFSFEHENPNIDATLKQIRGMVFIKQPKFKLITKEQQWNRHTVKELLSCYHVQEEAPDEDDLCDIQIEEVEGEREVECPPLESEVIVVSIKVKKVNIGTMENPKMASIGDYWDEKTVESITELLHKYNVIFPTTFT
jgi:hypothetical protein